ncbi:MAG TPA: glycosyltransferase, partial [Nitrospiria bacterium]|nr:glycosyltransferase [Nitrospiria bacterium]
MITTSFPRSKEDYSGIFVLRLCRALVAEGREVDVVAPADGESPSAEEMERCRIHRFSYFFPRKWQGVAYGPGGIPANLNRNPFLLLQIPFFLLGFFWKTYRIARSAELIHVHWIYSGIIASAVNALRGTPFVVTLRGSDALRSRRDGVSRSVSLWVLKRAAFITTVSEDLRNWLLSEGVPADRVAFIRNGVELNETRFERDSPQFTFLFVGSLVPGKGVRFLIDAFSLVVRRDGGVRLVLVGEGEEREMLQERARLQGVGDIVDFVGAESPDRVPLRMSQADCLVLPSLSEGSSNVVLEAMASSLPVVASDIPGMREIVQDGITGLLAKPQDTEDLTEKLLKVVRDEELRRRMGEK